VCIYHVHAVVSLPRHWKSLHFSVLFCGACFTLGQTGPLHTVFEIPMFPLLSDLK